MGVSESVWLTGIENEMDSGSVSCIWGRANERWPAWDGGLRLSPQ